MGTDLTPLPAQQTAHTPARAEGSPALPAGSLTRASSDDELVALWLRRPNLSRQTVRHGRKEATRFLFWIRAHGLQLAHVRFEDLVAYADFIADPQPAADWICPTRHRRADPRWRPFCGPLSEASQVQAMTILKGLFSWARAADYLTANPAKLLGALPVMRDDAITRLLPPVGISFLLAAASALPADTPGAALRRARGRFLVQAYYLTAVRLNELATAGMRSIRRDDAGRWWLHVMGKGKRRGKVPVPPALLAEYRAYREAFGLTRTPAPDDMTPLVLATRGPLRAASHYAIARSVKGIMQAAQQLAVDAELLEVAHRIGQASTHWLRHSSLSHQVNGGVPLATAQANGRHASIKTTGGYLHAEDAARHADTIATITIAPLPQA